MYVFRFFAIRKASHLVTQIYEQMPNEKGTTIYALQKQFQSMFGFTLPLFHGRGLLNCMTVSPNLLLQISQKF
jgi:hypothetical protein